MGPSLSILLVSDSLLIFGPPYSHQISPYHHNPRNQHPQRPPQRLIPLRLTMSARLGIQTHILQRITHHLRGLGVFYPMLIGPPGIARKAKHPGRILLDNAHHLIIDGLFVGAIIQMSPLLTHIAVFSYLIVGCVLYATTRPCMRPIKQKQKVLSVSFISHPTPH